MVGGLGVDHYFISDHVEYDAVGIEELDDSDVLYKDLMRPNHGPRVAEYYVEVLN